MHIKFSKTLSAVFLLLFLSGMSLNAIAISTASFKITKIKSIIINKKNTAANENFSLHINFKVNKIVTDWAIGFYMPRTFNRLNRKTSPINPNIHIQICTLAKEKICAPLLYVKKGLIKNNQVYGDGYSNVFTLKNNHSFPLQPRHVYRLEINNSNQGVPQNLSSMPQGFFLVTHFSHPTAQKIITTNAKISAFGHNFENIAGYNPTAIKRTVTEHIKKNWRRSMPLPASSVAIKYHLVPLPKKISKLNGRGFNFNIKTITYKNSYLNSENMKLLKKYLQEDLNIKLLTENNPNFIIKKRRDKNPESYQLTIKNNKITITAATNAGVFYAIQTLRQLWNQSRILPALQISDAPRFKYRGVLFDTARHYFTINKIKKLIDVMAAMKLNTLHLHFSDDEGWRLAINALPKAAQIRAATRGYVKGSVNPAALYQQANFDLTNYYNFSPKTGKIINKNYTKANTRYSGIYTKNQIKALIKYANARQITIIPEIDFPGHASALVHALPKVFINPNDKSNYISVQGFYQDVLPICLYNKAGKQAKAFTKITNKIIFDINKLFNNQTTLYSKSEVSVGGDEVSSNAWTNDTSCKDGWAQMDALTKSQAFFNALQKANPHVLLSGWQQAVQRDNGEIGQLSLDPELVGHIWVWEPSKDGIKQAQNLAKAAYPTVLSFADNLYFDLTYQPGVWQPGFYWAGSFLDTHAADYAAVNANNVVDGLSAHAQQRILGLEGDLWSEDTVNARHLFYMALPKMAGLAESAWSSRASITNNENQLAWQSLAARLGYDNHGFLGYLYKIAGVTYRGFPHGISMEAHGTPCFLCADRDKCLTNKLNE